MAAFNGQMYINWRNDDWWYAWFSPYNGIVRDVAGMLRIIRHGVGCQVRNFNGSTQVCGVAISYSYNGPLRDPNSVRLAVLRALRQKGWRVQ